MKFRVDRDALAEAVSWVARALPTRPVVPVLSGLRLDAAADGGLTLSCFDYEVSATAQIDAEVAEPGTVIVPGRLLTEITRNLPALAVDVAATDDAVNLTCGSAEFTLYALAADEYPSLPEPPPLAGTIDGGVLGPAIGQVAPAASRDDTLPMLTGVCLDIDGGTLTLAATDRYRLAVREMPWAAARPGLRAAALVPARTLADAARAMTPGMPVSVAFGTGPESAADGPGGRAAGGSAPRPPRRRGTAPGRRHDQLRDGRPAADRTADRRGVHPVPVPVPGRVRLPGRGARRAVRRGGAAGLAGRRPGQPGSADLPSRLRGHRGEDRGPRPGRGDGTRRVPRRRAGHRVQPALPAGRAHRGGQPGGARRRGRGARASPGQHSPGQHGPGQDGAPEDGGKPPEPGLVRIEFTSPAKPALITRVAAAEGGAGTDAGSAAVPEFRYLVVPLRAVSRS